MIDTKFTDDLASKAPVPGGGGASAYAGALAAALGSMVANLTIGKPKFADREQVLQETLARLDAYRSELISLIEGDAEAFSKLAACWKMPKGTEEERACRSRAEQEALHAACEVPLSIMRVCARVVEADEYLVLNSAKLALSDVGASAVLAKAALEAASLNVFINTGLMEDSAKALAYEEEANGLIEKTAPAADKVHAAVRESIVWVR